MLRYIFFLPALARSSHGVPLPARRQHFLSELTLIWLTRNGICSIQWIEVGQSGRVISNVMPDDGTNAQPVLSGVFRHALDEKHRVTIPARWRKGEQDLLYLMPSPDNVFLTALPPAQFRKVNDDLLNNPKISPADRRRFARYYFSQAQECVVDRQGRLLVPDEFCRLAALQSDLLLVGAFDRFELWNPQRWADIRETETNSFKQIADILGV